MMRKFGIKFSHHHPEGEQVRKQFINCSNSRQWRDVIDQYYLEDSSEETPSSVTDDSSYSGSMA